MIIISKGMSTFTSFGASTENPADEMIGVVGGNNFVDILLPGIVTLMIHSGADQSRRRGLIVSVTYSIFVPEKRILYIMPKTSIRVAMLSGQKFLLEEIIPYWRAHSSISTCH